MFIPFHAYEASAGSGKTFSLVVRYLSLLFMGEAPDRILALTFTNKAANEMQERIIETLKELETRGELKAISEVTGMDPAEILRCRGEVLGRFLNADAKVMTIDKFFAKVLRKFSLHAGLMPTFSTFESQHEIKVMARFLTLVEVEQKEAMLIRLSLLMTKRLSDIFSLLDELYAKSSELENIVFEPEPFEPYVAMVWEAHDELKALVEASNMSEGAKKTMRNETLDEIIARSWITRESLEYWQYKKGFVPEMDRLLQRIQKAVKAYMRAKENYFMHGLLELLDIYTEAKRRVAKEDGELSFDDITALVYYLLKGRIDSEFLYFRLDSRIDHLLLDEFQDTSVVQFEILRPIIEEMVSGQGVGASRSLFMVGDVKQSIYRFRGGTKELFYTVADTYGVQVDRLSTNYRSHRNVVEFVNDTFGGKMDHYVPQQVKEAAGEGYVEVTENDDVLAAMLEQVRRLIGKGASLNDIAVLTATNADGSAVEELLKIEDIEVVTETTSKLINQTNVRALIEYFKYLYFGETIYARNFFALIGRDYEPLARVVDDDSDLAAQAKRVIETYGLYDGDLNLLRFMEIVSHYRDIEQFLFEYERIDATAARTDLNGVRVLTVHKSKGLEYDHVIVMDRLGKASPDRSPIIYEYDGIRLRNLFLRMKHRAELDDIYAQAIVKEKRLSEEDGMNALYVAFTRARTTLVVIRKSKDSKFDLLELGLQRRGELAVEKAMDVPVQALMTIPYRSRSYGTQTKVLRAEDEDEHESDYKAIMFGLALHYTLEMMNDFSEASLVEALPVTHNRYGAKLEPGGLERIERRIRRLLETEKFRAITQGKCRKEQPLSYDEELRYIDLLVEKEEGWTVIDYKSSMRQHESHVQQVGFYKKAVSEIMKAPVDGYLCYLLDEGVKLVEV